MQFERRRNGAVYVAEAYADNQQALQALFERWPTGYVQWEMLGIPWREPDGKLTPTGPAYVFWRPKPQAAPSLETTNRTTSASASQPSPTNAPRNQHRGERSSQQSERSGSGRWSQKAPQQQRGKQDRNSAGRAGSSAAEKGSDRRQQSGSQPRRPDRGQPDRQSNEHNARRPRQADTTPAFNTVQPGGADSPDRRHQRPTPPVAPPAEATSTQAAGSPAPVGPARNAPRDAELPDRRHQHPTPPASHAVEAPTPPASHAVEAPTPPASHAVEAPTPPASHAVEAPPAQNTVQPAASATARNVPKRRVDRPQPRQQPARAEQEQREPQAGTSVTPVEVQAEPVVEAQAEPVVEAQAEPVVEVQAEPQTVALNQVPEPVVAPESDGKASDRTNRGPRTTKHKNITRLDRADKDMYGYLVRLMWRGETRQKFFSDRAYANAQEALEAAIAWRDEMERELGKPRSEGLVVGRASSNTGIVGVTRTTKRGDPVFQVTWYEDGRQRRRVFNIRLLGESKALRAAIKARAAAEEQRLIATASEHGAED